MTTILYDGDCSFCKLWVDWLLEQATEPLRLIPFQDRPEEFQKIPTSALVRAVHLVENDGTVIRGAGAIFRAMELRPQGTYFYRIYRSFGLFRKIADGFYGFVSRHRQFAAWATTVLWGKKIPIEKFQRVRRFFLSILGFCYGAAFLSLSFQVKGLIGENGISPASSLLNYISEKAGVARFFIFPNLAWVGGANNSMLSFYCYAGVFLSVFLIFNIAPRWTAALCWALYFSLTLLGNVFLGYQWEGLLLEAGFLALFLAPGGLRPNSKTIPGPRPALIWLFRWLVFRLIFSSGLAKLVSGDFNWTHLTALNFHFETQPLPTWIAWYAAKLPVLVLKSMTASVLFIETLVPLLFFLPRRIRICAFWFQMVLQVAIILTGNYCYFNILTMGLCLFLLDDHFLDSFLRTKPAKAKLRAREVSSFETFKSAIVGILAFVLIVAGATHIKNIVSSGDDLWNRWTTPLMILTQRYFICGSYGLFVNMTTERDEIIVEGSTDGTHWLPYEFPYKPGDLKTKPAFVAPYQPRLDWQMWFAALGDFDSQPWLKNLFFRLLQGQSDVLKLFKTNPFSSEPPHFIRASLYQYRFSDEETLKATGQWWTRTPKGSYSPVVSLNQ